jgi:hypothetical protein
LKNANHIVEHKVSTNPREYFSNGNPYKERPLSGNVPMMHLQEVTKSDKQK